MDRYYNIFFGFELSLQLRVLKAIRNFMKMYIIINISGVKIMCSVDILRPPVIFLFFLSQ